MHKVFFYGHVKIIHFNFKIILKLHVYVDLLLTDKTTEEFIRRESIQGS